MIVDGFSGLSFFLVRMLIISLFVALALRGFLIVSYPDFCLGPELAFARTLAQDQWKRLGTRQGF